MANARLRTTPLLHVPEHLTHKELEAVCRTVGVSDAMRATMAEERRERLRLEDPPWPGWPCRWNDPVAPCNCPGSEPCPKDPRPVEEQES